MSEKLKQTGLWMRILCALILLVPAFSHRPALAASAPVYQDEAYRLPDGTFADICAGHEPGSGIVAKHELPGNDNHDRLAGRLICEACLLVSTMLPPAPDDNSWIRTEFSFLENVLTDHDSLIGRTSVERPRSRSPPVFS